MSVENEASEGALLEVEHQVVNLEVALEEHSFEEEEDRISVGGLGRQ